MTMTLREFSPTLRRLAATACALAGLLLLPVAPAVADGGVVFTDIAENGGAGISYSRVPSPRLALQQAINDLGTLPGATWPTIRANESPQKAKGAPGVALFDYDGDGDLDIYVTNGPGAYNSLYANQLVETGAVTFVDQALTAGVGAFDQDSSGVCYGDTDNDGDDDLYVLGTGEPHRFFENNGDGTFTDITGAAGLAADSRYAVGCSFADFDGDGLLDVVIANTYEAWDNRRPTFTNELYPGLEHNHLFINQGGNSFSDQSAAAGLEAIDGLPGGSYTWAIATADYDRDGDVDIFYADTQGPAPTDPSEDRGYNRIFQNDGNGNFTDVTIASNLDHHGSWMGFSFGDFNCDGNLDFFDTNLGDYVPGALGVATSRWFLQNADGTFSDPGVGDLISSAFGWGTVTTDYDNDGDTDIVYHGGVDVMTVIVADNPGLVLQNEGCSADFEYDFGAITREHRTRLVQGVARGDLNGDGFDDLVTVADSVVVPGPFWLPWSGILAPPYGSALDPLTRFEGVWIGGGGVITYLFPTTLQGDLAVEINSGDNGNGWAAFDTVGGVGLAPGATNNRNGFGAVLSFTPDGGPTSMVPVIGGASYASQDSQETIFGLGSATRGTVEVLWNGGAKNRLYDVQAGERLTLPEIPCSYDGAWKNFGQYNACVMQALNAYKAAGMITDAERNRLRDNARRAFEESR